MLHSVSRLDIDGDKEVCLLREGEGGKAEVVTKHNMENRATQRSVIPAKAESQQFQFTGYSGTKW